ncbi:hypothetical protein Dimus_031903, partial [Dionaea muscipula]
MLARPLQEKREAEAEPPLCYPSPQNRESSRTTALDPQAGIVDHRDHPRRSHLAFTIIASIPTSFLFAQPRTPPALPFTTNPPPSCPTTREHASYHRSPGRHHQPPPSSLLAYHHLRRPEP